MQVRLHYIEATPRCSPISLTRDSVVNNISAPCRYVHDAKDADSTQVFEKKAREMGK